MRIVIRAEDIQQRNPVARELRSAKFRKQVVRDRTKYRRKEKHKKRLTDC